MDTLSVDLGPVTLKNPLIPASGTFGYGKEASDFFDISTLGALLTKSITQNPRAGNPQPRIVECAGGILNSIGLENKGYDYFEDTIYPFIKSIPTSLWVSIAGSTDEEYFYLVEKLSRLDIDAIEVNVSCPNVREGGVQFCQNHSLLTSVLKGIRSRTNKPIWVKISLETQQIQETARLIQKLGADGICVGNTIKGLAINPLTLKPYFANTVAGLSGPAIKPIALKAVWDVYGAVPDLPIIGCGGIACSQDVIEFIAVGATAVEVGTANMVNPLLMKTMIENLTVYCREKNIKIKELIGIAHRKE